MKYNSFKISKLIFRFLTNRLEKGDEHSFKAWLEEKDSNRDFLSGFEHAENLKDDFEVFTHIDPLKDWDELKKKIDNSSRKQALFRLKIAAVASVLLFSMGLVYVFVSEQNVTNTSLQVKNTVRPQRSFLPAKSGAQLILADGNTLMLKEDKQGTAHGSGYRVEIGNDGVQYLETGKEQEKVGINTLLVPKGEYYNIILPDGTKVWVNAMSKLKFPVRFAKSERVVELEGEAFFDVYRDESRPFVVIADQVRVQVLGTVFNVNAYNTKYIRTSLLNGSVKVDAGTNDVQFLKPGERADFIGGSFSIKKADLRREIAWKNREFFFKDDNIVHVMNEISRWYDVDVTFASDIDFESSYSGNVSRQEPLAKVLDVLSFVGELSFSVKENKVIVENKKNSL